MARDMSGEGEGDLVSYLTLRRLVGVLGVSMPLIVMVWGFFILSSLRVLPSISDYYSLRTRDVFVGTLFAIGWFLYTYRGYDRQDNVTGNLACVFALGVALFPDDGPGLNPIIHFISATLLFLALAYFSLFLFTKTDGSPTQRKKVRNSVYRTCGVVMLACILLIGLCYWLGFNFSESTILKPVFWLETFALWAFGFSWFVKGETFWKDLEPPHSLPI